MIDVIQGPIEKISPEEVKSVLDAMIMGKAAGRSGVVAEILKATGTDGVSWMTICFWDTMYYNY